jgi:hypothetical protein
MEDITKIAVDIWQAIALSAGAVVVYVIYRLQKKDNNDEINARLANSYSNYHSHILQSERTISLSKELIWNKYSTTQVAKIHFIYFTLNTLYIEWSFCNTNKQDRDQFSLTLDVLIGRFARHISDDSLFLVDEFDEIFSDFPKNFRSDVKACIRRNLRSPKAVSDQVA